VWKLFYAEYLLCIHTLPPPNKHLQVNLDSQKEITDCYMFVWKLFYAEYLLIPLLL
jgi:hypothetical protein